MTWTPRQVRSCCGIFQAHVKTLQLPNAYKSGQDQNESPSKNQDNVQMRSAGQVLSSASRSYDCNLGAARPGQAVTSNWSIDAGLCHGRSGRWRLSFWLSSLLYSRSGCLLQRGLQTVKRANGHWIKLCARVCAYLLRYASCRAPDHFSTLLRGSLLTNYYCQPLLQELFTLHCSSQSFDVLLVDSFSSLRAKSGTRTSPCASLRRMIAPQPRPFVRLVSRQLRAVPCLAAVLESFCCPIRCLRYEPKAKLELWCVAAVSTL